MNIEELREYCLSVKGASESFPFDEYVLVFKVMNKMFAYTNLKDNSTEFSFNVKCDPEKAIELREQYEGIQPGFHANKKYWNTIFLDSDVSAQLIKEQIDHSVEEVIKKLSKKLQAEYHNSQF